MKKLKLFFFAIALLVSGGVWGGNVAKIGNTEYTTLDLAVLEVQNGQTIELIDDVSVGTSTCVIIDKPEISFTIDLKGYHITGGKASASYGILKFTAGNVIIKDSGTNGSIGTIGTGTHVLNLQSTNAKVTLESGTIQGMGHVVFINAGNFIMNGGNVQSSATSSTRYCVTINSASGTFTMNGGTINGTNTASTAEMWGVYNYGGVVCMTGGTVSVSGKAHTYGIKTASTGGSITISDGTVYAETTESSKNAFAVYGSVSATSPTWSCPVYIYGGKFGHSGGKGTADVQFVRMVLGGKFMTGSADGYSDGYQLSSSVDDNNYHSVEPVSPSKMVAKVGSAEYFSLTKAFLEAPDNSTIQLLNTVSVPTLGITSPANKTLTLDLNGKTIDFGAFNLAVPTSTYLGRLNIEGNLTIKDLSQNQEGIIKTQGDAKQQTYSITVQAGGSLNFESGTIHGKMVDDTKSLFGVYSLGDVTVSGGTFKMESNTTGYVGAITASGNGSLSIIGGNFHIKSASTTDLKFAGGDNIQVTGGVFTKEAGSGFDDNTLFAATTQITGGQFNFNPEPFLPLGDKMVSNTGTAKVTPFEDEQTLVYSVVTNPNPTMVVKNINTLVEYASPYEAVAEANEGDELQLLEDINLSNYSLTIDKPLTLNINGKTLSSTTNTISIQSGNKNNPMIVTDKAQDKGSIIGVKSIAISNIDGLNVEISDVVLNGTVNCIYNNSKDAIVNVSNVTGSVSSSKSSPTSTISVLHSAKQAFITITNCDFSINCPNATATTSQYSASVIYYQSNLGSCIINGGFYSANSKTTTANIIKYYSSKSAVTVYDGKFKITSENASKIAFYGSSSTSANTLLSIQGGYFTMDPNTWLAPTHTKVTLSGDPDYTYKVIEQNAASVNGVNYGSVQEAMAAVEADPTLGAITLLRNVSIQTPLEISSNITFAETSYTMTLNGNPSIILKTGATMPSCIAAPMEASAPKEGKTYYYTTFNTALSNNSAVKLEADVTYDGYILLTTGTKTIDLNGHTLSGNQEYSFIEVKYYYGEVKLNIINTGSQEGVLINTNTNPNSHVIDINQKYGGIIYPGSSAKVIVGENVKVKGNMGVVMWHDDTFLEVHGAIESKSFAISGNGTPEHWGTNIHIYEGANLYASAAPAIYHPQDGTLIIEGGTISGYQSAVEIRSGTVDITGGTLISRYVSTEQETNPNSNGTTTTGVGIAVVQHVTENPITVNISGNTVVQAIMPVKLANPQENEAINEVQVNIQGGKFATTQGTSNVFWSATENFAVSAGKFSHVPAYVVEGKAVVANEDDDKDIYPYKIGVVTEKTNDAQGTGDIIWEINDDWKRNGEDQHTIPVSTDKVTVANGQNVIVTGKEEGEGEDTDGAFAYSIDIADGGQLIVKSGAKLVVGKGGITEADKSDQSVIVEDGGVLLIEPTADVADETGKVEYIAKTFKRNDGWEEFYDHGYQLDLFGNPIEGETTITANPTGYTVWLNTWNPYTGWGESDLAAFKASTFTGFMFWNNRPQTESRVKYTFSGKLVGNQVNTMQFTSDGYKCFANSYTAPIDVKALLQGVEGDLQRAVYIYLPETDQFIDINNAKLQVPTFEYRQIAPMQGFFVRNLKDTTLTAPIDYVSMVWGPAFPGGSGAPSAPARDRNAINQTQVRINLTDNTAQRTDYVFLVEGEQYSAERDASDIEKMMNSTKGVNIYANTQLGALSTMQTNDLDGQALTITTNPSISYTMSFDWVAGEDLYLFDAEKNSYTLIAEDARYEFIANASSTISNRFSVVKHAPQVTTEVVEVQESAPAVQGVYSITGQFLGDASAWHTLPAGVYVIDGQKIVK